MNRFSFIYSRLGVFIITLVVIMGASAIAASTAVPMEPTTGEEAGASLKPVQDVTPIPAQEEKLATEPFTKFKNPSGIRAVPRNILPAPTEPESIAISPWVVLFRKNLEIGSMQQEIQAMRAEMDDMRELQAKQYEVIMALGDVVESLTYTINQLEVVTKS